MAFVTVEDLYGAFQVLAFPECYEKYRELFTAENKIYLKGKATIGRDEEASVIPEKVFAFESVKKEVWIAFDSLSAYEAGCAELTRLCEENRGEDRVVVYLRDRKAMKRLGTGCGVNAGSKCLGEFSAVFGNANVKTRTAGLP